MQDQSTRTWIWTSLIVQALGYLFDVAWHGLLSPGAEPQTVGQMARHLATVHLPLYIGAASVLASTATALRRQRRRSAIGTALPIAFAGALLSAAAEAWHASSHLRLHTRSAPIAGILSVIGFITALTAVSVSTWSGRPRAERTAA